MYQIGHETGITNDKVWQVIQTVLHDHLKRYLSQGCAVNKFMDVVNSDVLVMLHKDYKGRKCWINS